ncbi:heavy metal translocating P-type ATPase [Domibacillus sp. DTU_2020_1001157_1_SI_ALB_TIR_016]|uniref:heavy metal translocating P-type ATPase n=1 Tax=Domibacillus sp. DTU_2020_1001157_1_SI_ALB_TIR_016 TaxID=3077789 RepID=UPI0028E1F564|nr:heavy metal translocating P-type ATPase [Domibacillus sp. DTU_2020_1001157_1_SI_ALB_TIR_016]WNS80157.1 heavy metal translocating P-type ATPase [Domibacillus sp. DTU_2020_1001157_1_SI_ALB_TIR_016]
MITHIENQPAAKKWFDELTPHIELIAALFSGLLIVAGWLLDRNGSDTASVVLYLSAFLIGGYAKAKEGIEATIEEKELNVEMLMILAAAGSAAIGYWTEGAILIFIFAMSGALETYTMNKSQREISALMEIQPDTALVVRNGTEESVHVSELKRGDVIVVKPGERVPADGRISKGYTTIDEAAITGESIPVSKEAGADVFAGTVNMTGSVYIDVTKRADETLFQKIINLVQSAQSEKSPSQQFIERFEGIYVKAVLAVVVLMMFLPHYLLGWSWTETFYRAMVLLVVASPCALVASIMPATLSAISTGARNGILFKGGAHLENLSHVKAIAFDKTGTLTRGKPEVTDVIIRDDVAHMELLGAAASIESRSNHPLAHAIVRYVNEQGIAFSPPEHVEDAAGWGVKGTVGTKTWKIGKADFVGNEQAAAFADGAALQFAQAGKTTVYVADENGIAAIIALQDIIREETKQALKTLQDEGIFTIMLTGDSEKTARAIASEASLDSYIADCLPEHKVDQVKKLLETYGTVAMVGDGINDAPALASASVGIAMGEGSDVALETADIVLMKNDLPKIADAIKLSRRMQKIVKQNIIFSISVIVLLIISNFFQMLDLPFGVIGHEGSTILVILNGLRLLKHT